MLASMTSRHRQSIVLDSANDVSDVSGFDNDSGAEGHAVFGQGFLNPGFSGRG
jgi:hypothetical protein